MNKLLRAHADAIIDASISAVKPAAVQTTSIMEKPTTRCSGSMDSAKKHWNGVIATRKRELKAAAAKNQAKFCAQAQSSIGTDQAKMSSIMSARLRPKRSHKYAPSRHKIICSAVEKEEMKPTST